MLEEKDITGQRFGRLIAIGLHHKKRKNSGGNLIYWLFKCDCGKTKITEKWSVISGDAKSCGCLRSELIIKKNFKHGMAKRLPKPDGFYKCWSDMKAQCLNINNLKYKYFGERGIKIDNNWLNFINFKKDLLESYNSHIKKFGRGLKYTSLSRKDYTKGFFKENCYWALINERANNKRLNIKLTFNGKTLGLREWAKKLNIKYNTLRNRYQKGWPIKEILYGR